MTMRPPGRKYRLTSYLINGLTRSRRSSYLGIGHGRVIGGRHEVQDVVGICKGGKMRELSGRRTIVLGCDPEVFLSRKAGLRRQIIGSERVIPLEGLTPGS